MEKLQVSLLLIALILVVAWIYPPWKHEVGYVLPTGSGGYEFRHQEDNRRQWHFRFVPPEEKLGTWSVDEPTMYSEMIVLALSGAFIGIALYRKRIVP
jgi:hypothetical protein